MNQIQELLTKFNYPQLKHTELYWISRFLVSDLAIDLPRDKFAIKKYANFMRSKINFIDLKRNHAIELISRLVFKENWHKLSKKIPDLIELKYNNRKIQYGENSIDLANIGDIQKLGICLVLISKRKDKLLTILHPENDNLFEFINSHKFDLCREYWHPQFKTMNFKETAKLLENSLLFNKDEHFIKEEIAYIKIKDIIEKRKFLYDNFINNKKHKRWNKINEIVSQIKSGQKIDNLIVSENLYELFYGTDDLILACEILNIKEIPSWIVSSKFLGPNIKNPNYIENKKYYIVATEDEKEQIIPMFQESFIQVEGIVYYDNIKEAIFNYTKNRNRLDIIMEGLKLVIFELELNPDLNNIKLSIKNY